jgi:methionyl-tRNA synthetase
VCEALRVAGALLSPFMPGKMNELADALGVGPSGIRLEGLGFGQGGPFRVKAGTPLFPRIEAPAAAPASPAAPSQKKLEAPPVPEGKPEVSYEDFGKLDLRVGVVKAAERVRKSDKLLRLLVDIGEERQVVAGIGRRFAPEDLVGRQVMVVANLKPVKLMGVESRGMVLAAGGETDLELATFPEGVPPGTRVK